MTSQQLGVSLRGSGRGTGILAEAISNPRMIPIAPSLLADLANSSPAVIALKPRRFVIASDADPRMKVSTSFIDTPRRLATLAVD